jgi:hypothetical protein
MKLRKFFPIIGIIIFVVLLFRLDLSQIANEISNIKINFLFIAIAFSLLIIITQTLKWFVIARYQKIKVPFLEAIKINLIGSFFGTVTPAKIGGVLRSEYLKKYSDNKIGKPVGNFIIEKILDLCSIGFLAVIASLILSDMLPIKSGVQIIILLVFVLMLVVVLNENISRKFFSIGKKLFGKMISLEVKNKIKGEVYSFYADKPNNKYFFLFFLINLLSWITLYVTTYFVGRALGIDISVFYYLTILPVVTLISQIPITVAGLGVREGTMMGIFGLLGVEATKVFSMSLLGLIIGELIPGFFGFLYSRTKRKTTI